MITLGVAALVLLPLIAIIGGIEFRGQLLAVLRKVDAAAAKLPPFMAHQGRHRDPAREVWVSARRTPQGLETPAAAGTAPDPGEARPSRTGSGATVPSRLLDTAELAVLHPRAHRHVNGRLLADQPRTYGQVPVATVLAAEELAAEELAAEELAAARQEARAAGEWARVTGRAAPADPALLKRIHNGLLALPTAVYRGDL